MAHPESNPNDNRRGLIATVLFHVALVLLFIFYGLTYQDPPPEDGIAINFGYEDDGSGTTTQSAPQESQPQAAQPIEEEIATQEMVEAPSVNTEKPKEKPVEKPIEKPKEEQKPDSRLQGALDKTKNQTGDGQGEGETTGGGDQGDPNGDRNSPNRTGTGGTGNTGDYRLGGRKALARPKPIYDCPEEGRVVVKVYVDRTGKVVNAIAGEKIPPDGPASTTSSSCLYERARSAAMRTTWQGEASAPDMQVGYIIYNFQKR
jgi:outer membrane biosynthesis protein TonB